MWFYRNNIVAIHAALVVSVFAWLWGGMRGPELVPVMPWLVALLAEAMLFFPERRSEDESMFHARDRVWRAMRRDPLVWIEIGFLVLLLIPFVNTGLCPSCDAKAIAEGANPKPLVSFLPYCVSRPNHLSVFLWFLPTLTAVTAVRHSLTKRGKRLFCEMVVWNAAVLAVLGFVQQVAKAPGPLWWDEGLRNVNKSFFSTFGYSNAAGSFFVSVFALSVAVWRRHADDVREDVMSGDGALQTKTPYQRFWLSHYMAIPTILVFFAAYSTLSRAAIILVSCAAAVLTLHAAVCTLARLDGPQRIRVGALMAVGVVLLSLFVSLFMPNRVREEMRTIRGSQDILNRVTSKEGYHTRIATDLILDHTLFGCGGWGYAHLSVTKMTKDELEGINNYWSRGMANVHNDYLQFLVEHGVIGVGCLVAMVVLLLLTPCRTWMALARATRFAGKNQQLPKPYSLFAFPGGAFAVLVGAGVVLVHAFADCPFRSPAVLALFYCELAALDGFLPRINLERAEEKSVSHTHKHGHAHNHEHTHTHATETSQSEAQAHPTEPSPTTEPTQPS